MLHGAMCTPTPFANEGKDTLHVPSGGFHLQRLSPFNLLSPMRPHPDDEPTEGVRKTLCTLDRIPPFASVVQKISLISPTAAGVRKTQWSLDRIPPTANFVLKYLSINTDYICSVENVNLGLLFIYFDMCERGKLFEINLQNIYIFYVQP